MSEPHEGKILILVRLDQKTSDLPARRVSRMAYNAKKTEHAGPKKGSGAFYGRKALAKKGSNRRRREADKQAVSNHGASQA